MLMPAIQEDIDIPFFRLAFDGHWEKYFKAPPVIFWLRSNVKEILFSRAIMSARTTGSMTSFRPSSPTEEDHYAVEDAHLLAKFNFGLLDDERRPDIVVGNWVGSRRMPLVRPNMSEKTAVVRPGPGSGPHWFGYGTNGDKEDYWVN